MGAVTAGKRRKTRARLKRVGLARLRANRQQPDGRPTHAQTDVTALLGELNAGEQVIYFRADYPYNRSEQTLQKLVADCWSLSEVAVGYHEFIVSFRPLMALLREVDPAALTPLRCFQIAIIDSLLPSRGVERSAAAGRAAARAVEGQIARNLCINLYQQVDRAATEYVSALAETTIGALPAPAAGYYRRFGGLPRDPTF